jgi:putative holliday junction resolvase
MKILALDLGDTWVGSAISDPLGITCKPYQTVTLSQLPPFIEATLAKESICTVVIGHPRTMTGGQSDQTIKIVKMKEALERQFTTVGGQPITWILWDERLSSKRAGLLQNNKSVAESKKKSHSLAAAFILQSYLDYLALHRA